MWVTLRTELYSVICTLYSVLLKYNVGNTPHGVVLCYLYSVL